MEEGKSSGAPKAAPSRAPARAPARAAARAAARTPAQKPFEHDARLKQYIKDVVLRVSFYGRTVPSGVTSAVRFLAIFLPVLWTVLQPVVKETKHVYFDGCYAGTYTYSYDECVNCNGGQRWVEVQRQASTSWSNVYWIFLVLFVYLASFIRRTLKFRRFALRMLEYGVLVEDGHKQRSFVIFYSVTAVWTCLCVIQFLVLADEDLHSTTLANDPVTPSYVCGDNMLMTFDDDNPAVAFSRSPRRLIEYLLVALAPTVISLLQLYFITARPLSSVLDLSKAMSNRNMLMRVAGHCVARTSYPKFAKALNGKYKQITGKAATTVTTDVPTAMNFGLTWPSKSNEAEIIRDIYAKKDGTFEVIALNARA